jgi:hypothetical protein
MADIKDFKGPTSYHVAIGGDPGRIILYHGDTPLCGRSVIYNNDNRGYVNYFNRRYYLDTLTYMGSSLGVMA